VAKSLQAWTAPFDSETADAMLEEAGKITLADQLRRLNRSGDEKAPMG